MSRTETIVLPPAPQATTMPMARAEQPTAYEDQIRDYRRGQRRQYDLNRRIQRWNPFLPYVLTYVMLNDSDGNTVELFRAEVLWYVVVETIG